MVEKGSKFEAGVESMRQVAIEKVAAWHVAKWNDQPSLSPDEVHNLLNAIVGDIRVASVPGT
jgi:hypothetical protein